MTSILHVGFVSPIFDKREDDHEDEDGNTITDDVGPRHAGELVALHKKDASWKRMQFMQPACEIVRVRCNENDELFDISNPRGVTLQDLVDGLRNHWFDCPLCATEWDIQRWDYQGFFRDEVILDELDPIDSAWQLLKELDKK